MPDRSSWLHTAFDWTDQRLNLRQLVEYARHKQVPQHQHTFWPRNASFRESDISFK